MMFFVYDENIPSKIPEVLKKIIEIPDESVEIHSVDSLSLRSEKDVDLFKKIRGLSNGKKCILVTGDKMILKHKPEIESLKSNNLIAFICPPSFSQKTGFERAIYLLNAWTAMFEVAKKSKPKDIYSLPAKQGLNFTIKEILKGKK